MHVYVFCTFDIKCCVIWYSVMSYVTLRWKLALRVITAERDTMRKSFLHDWFRFNKWKMLSPMIYGVSKCNEWTMLIHRRLWVSRLLQCNMRGHWSSCSINTVTPQRLVFTVVLMGLKKGAEIFICGRLHLNQRWIRKAANIPVKLLFGSHRVAEKHFIALHRCWLGDEWNLHGFYHRTGFINIPTAEKVDPK